MKSKEQIEEDFEWWITCIPDKIERLGEIIPEIIFSKLDYSVESLSLLGKYICISVENVENLKKSSELWDCLTCYIGTTYRRCVPTAKWRIELIDNQNIYYGIPALRTEKYTNFYPKYELTAMLDRKNPDFLYLITKKHIELQR